MLLGFGVLRLLDLNSSHAVLPRRYEVMGWRRITHRVAQNLCFLAALVPLLQLNGRLAEIAFTRSSSPIAPFEFLGAVPLHDLMSTCSLLLMASPSSVVMATCSWVWGNSLTSWQVVARYAWTGVVLLQSGWMSLGQTRKLWVRLEFCKGLLKMPGRVL
jgi:hypothetical protein